MRDYSVFRYRRGMRRTCDGLASIADELPSYRAEIRLRTRSVACDTSGQLLGRFTSLETLDWVMMKNANLQ